MEFRIADTFTASLARLTGEEQKAVKTTAFDLQLDPASPGMRFHRLDRAKDRNFWSVRVSSDLRIIVHRSESSLLLCYVGHHDRAYDWAERRKLEVHPRTGAAQLVEVRETVREVVVPVHIAAAVAEPAAAYPAAKPVFEAISDDELLGYGVPPEWLTDVRQATGESLLSFVDHLPAEAAEALLELATGGRPRPAAPPPAPAGPFDHPDAQRRFRVMGSAGELERALAEPWEKWIVFLHPEQRALVEKEFQGPARVGGSAGTGKTIVALHRAFHLARRHSDARVLLATFSDTLANALRGRLRRLLGGEPGLGERIEVHALDAVALRLARARLGPVALAGRKTIVEVMADAAAAAPAHRFSPHFLVAEWEHVVDAWGLEGFEAFRDFVRLGRKTRLSEARRKELWAIFERVRSCLRDRKLLTPAGLFRELAGAITRGRKPPFDFAVIDEAQDITPAQLAFCAALGGGRPDALFFAGDMGQRIFQSPFSWKAAGVDVRGRSRTLRVNYRTSHQIRAQADRLLGAVVKDLDGNEDVRSDTVSVFNGPEPAVRTFPGREEEIDAVAAWIGGLAREGVAPQEIGLFIRSEGEIGRARAAAGKAGLAASVLDERVQPSAGQIAIGTMHLAKGLEFRAVVVMACDDEVLPLQARISEVGEEADLQEVYDTERHLLYVACTRARDNLLVTGVEPASEFLDDLRSRRS